MRPDPFWAPPPLFAGATVYILASGPSLTPEIAARVRGRPCIAVKATAATLAPWADIWFSGDGAELGQYAAEAAGFLGLLVTQSRRPEVPPNAKRIRAELSAGFPPPPLVRQGRSSGHTAVALAVAMRAARAALCGFDMRAVDGREHHHPPRPGRTVDPGIYAREYVPAFRGWHAAGLAAGCEIVNATEGSAIDEFPRVRLEDVLLC